MLRLQVGYHGPTAVMTELTLLFVFDVPSGRFVTVPWQLGRVRLHRIFFSWNMKPVSRRAAISDMLYTVANVHVEASCVVVDISYHDLGVGVIVARDVFDIKFTLEH